MSGKVDTPKTYNGAYGICRNFSNQILLVRIAGGVDKGLWTLPGGGVEWGEHPDKAVVRELEEETGISDVRQLKLTSIFSHKYMRSENRPFDSVHYIGIIYELILGDYNLRFEQNGSTDRCEWFTKEQVQKLTLVPLVEYAIDFIWPK